MPSASWPDREDLRKVAESHSVDLATLYLADLVARDPRSVDCRERYQYYLHHPDSERLVKHYHRYRILFVPGWDYVKSGHLTGADLVRPRRLKTEMGIENQPVEIDLSGSVEENTTFILTELTKPEPKDTRIIIAGVSSAGPVICLALDKIKKQKIAAPAAWINIGGILQGSPLFEHYNNFPGSWFMNAFLYIKDWRKEAIASMGASASKERYQTLNLPDGMVAMNYAGLSLSGQLSNYAKGGPSDGLTLLADILVLDSLTLIATNSDHFFAEDPLIDAKTGYPGFLTGWEQRGIKSLRMSILFPSSKLQSVNTHCAYILGPTCRVFLFLGLVTHRSARPRLSIVKPDISAP